MGQGERRCVAGIYGRGVEFEERGQSEINRKVTFYCIFMPPCGQNMRASMILGS